MGSSASKPALAPVVVAREDEKRSASINDTASALAGLRIGSRPSSADGTLALSTIAGWEVSASSDAKTTLARTILQHSNIRDALQSRRAHISDVHVFNHELQLKTLPVTNQKSSGRCWIFATTNVLRYNVIKKLDLKEFQLSQAYTFFYDKLNKANYYLENSIELADLPVDDRLVTYLADELISDGGQWDMVVNLLETYGVVPHEVFPESLHSSLSSPLNALIKSQLRGYALVLRNLSAALRQNAHVSADERLATLRSKKEELMGEVYCVMSATLGVVPAPDAKFKWDYYDKDGKAHAWEGTPREFYKSFAVGKYSTPDYFSLIHDPRNDYKKLYSVDRLGNIWGGRPVLYVNTEITDLKNAIVKMIKAGLPVFFGCDVGKFSHTPSGIMDTALYDYEGAFDITLSMNKAERLQTTESAMTHAMVISGVHLDADGRPVRYKVENSWGETAGDKGYMVMTDAWFDEYVYQVVVPKALAPKELVKVLEDDARIVLPAWDPMGALA